MIRRLYNFALALSAKPSAPFWLFGVALAEASVFPLPPDALLVPMALARPQRAYFYAAIATLGSVLGGAIGYFIGFELFAKLAQPIINFYHYGAAFAAFQHKFTQYGAAVILLKGLTPIPYKIVTIAAGAARFNFSEFMLLSLITRGARFFLEAILLHAFGEPARNFIEHRLGLITGMFAALIIAGFLILKFA